MNAAELLGYARRLLDTTPTTTGGNSARLAAVVARQALEYDINVRCAALGFDLPGVSMRSRLLILRSLDDRDAAERLASLWSQLSECCHQHAYELSPTVPEVRGLCVTLTSLISA